MTPLAVARFPELLEEKHADGVTEPPHNLTEDMMRFHIQPFVSLWAHLESLVMLNINLSLTWPKDMVPVKTLYVYVCDIRSENDFFPGTHPSHACF